MTDTPSIPPALTDAEAKEATMQLMERHGLAFTINPGGGEFYRAGWRCQVPYMNDAEDYETLRAALTANPPK